MKSYLVACAAAAAIVAAPAAADESAVTFDETGVKLDIAGDDLSLNLGGRVHFDFASYDDDVTLFTDDAKLRRARLELGGRVLKDWRFRVDREFGPVSKGFKNAWLAYRGLEGFEFKGGSFIVPFSAEDLSSSNSTTAMERSLANALAPSFLVGGQAKAFGNHWSLAGGYFFNALSSDSTVNNDAGRSIAARATFAPINSKDTVLHFGAGVERRMLDAAATTRVRTFPESGIADARLIDTGVLSGVDRFTSLNGEAALRAGSITAAGQYIRRMNKAPALRDPTFEAGYAEIAWVLTGEKRPYSEREGVFGGFRPKSKFGAVELVGRYSFLDLNDELVAGGVEKDMLVGVNWYLGPNFRLMANYVHAKATPNLNGIDESADVIQGRAQIAF